MSFEEAKDEQSLILYFEDSASSLSRKEFTEEETEALEIINTRIGSGGSLEEIVDFLFFQCRVITETDRLGLVFLEEEGLRAVSKVVRTRYQPVLLQSGYSEDIRAGSLPRVISRGHPRIIRDLATYAHLHPESRSSVLLAEEGVRSSMTCPLLVNGRIVGLLFRNSRKPDIYGRHEVLLHQAMAERLSQTVEKTYRIHQLETANRNYTEMLSFVGHELKSPLGSIVMTTDILTEGYLGDLNEEQLKRLGSITDKANYLLGMIEDYLNLGRIENAELAASFTGGIDFRERVLQTALNITADLAETKNIQIETEIATPLPAVICDPDLMRIVMVNLLSNAIKYNENNGLVRIQAKETEHNLTVQVYNTGPGFPATMKSKLFRKFSRLDVPELMKRKGTGVGLYTVWRIIKLHGGVILADSVEGQWAKFSFTIPVQGPEE